MGRETAERPGSAGCILPSTGKRNPGQKLIGYLLGFLAVYYSSFFLFFSNNNNNNNTSVGGNRASTFEYNAVSLGLVPIGLSVVVFGSVCLTKILLDISISNHPKIHEEAYHELLSDIRMAKEDLRSKGISVD
ncbi:hypothetical protein PGT21_020289 [Puccinia graminis f. sp. tritici]|uniref:Dolichol-phosphate mannosyltransferase subunit 3 n=1 Tax=Puccinia graminis f. sp. tritici TaxID=56615 RepID=A0A5B0M5L0_PUCGR|nr:hypothetical protein PGT21_020289 [Puccinia graminis f. sp. tritici]KAA1125837.1 hypothetical protein PGTUg99_005978 [Puccinia graminis f. sp. tritici]